jgi:hypothetical protein
VRELHGSVGAVEPSCYLATALSLFVDDRARALSLFVDEII